MKSILKPLTLALAVAAALAACKKQDAPAADATPAAADQPALTIDQSKLPDLPHFAKADLDDASPVCVDLNQHVNSKWLAANPVPNDRTTWGSFEMLGERSLAVQ